MSKNKNDDERDRKCADKCRNWSSQAYNQQVLASQRPDLSDEKVHSDGQLMADVMYAREIMDEVFEQAMSYRYVL